jgi:hypothetical protein
MALTRPDMKSTITHPLAAAAAAAVTLSGCIPERTEDRGDAVPVDAAAEQRPLPAELTDPARAPDPRILLPPLPGYVVDDQAESGEVEASLDHGPVAYEQVRRRIILGDDGFGRGEVVVVTLRPGANGADRFIEHTYGNARQEQVRIGGVDMVRIDAGPHPVLVWPAPTFVVAFSRGQSMSDAWLKSLAAATVDAVVQRR